MKTFEKVKNLSGNYRGIKKYPIIEPKRQLGRVKLDSFKVQKTVKVSKFSFHNSHSLSPHQISSKSPSLLPHRTFLTSLSNPHFSSSSFSFSSQVFTTPGMRWASSKTSNNSWIKQRRPIGRLSDQMFSIGYDEKNEPILRFIIPPGPQPGSILSENSPFRRRKVGMGDAKDPELTLLEIRKDGETQEVRMSKQEILKHPLLTDASLRDLRTVTTGQSLRQISAILPRKNAIILKLEYLKAIIGAESAFLFDPEQPQVQEFVESLQRRLRANIEAGITSDPFEFSFLEAMLEDVSHTFENRLYFLSLIASSLEKITRHVDFEHLIRLVMFKRSLNYFETEIKEFTEALHELLEQDDDELSSMYLSHLHTTGSQRPQADHTEIEMLFESYYRKMQEITNEVARLGKNIEDSYRFHEMSLDSTRNRLMHVNLQMAMITTALNSGMLIAALFGMNLLTELEESPKAFMLVAGSACALTVITYGAFLLYYMQSNRNRLQLPNTQNLDLLDPQISFEDFHKQLEVLLGKPLSSSEASLLFSCFEKARDEEPKKVESKSL